VPEAHRKQQYCNVSLAQIYVRGQETQTFDCSVKSKIISSSIYPDAVVCCMCSGDRTLRESWGLTDFSSYFLPGSSCYLVCCEKIHRVSASTICHLSPLHLPALPEADGNLDQEMIFHSCSETPGDVGGLSV